MQGYPGDTIGCVMFQNFRTIVRKEGDIEDFVSDPVKFLGLI